MRTSVKNERGEVASWLIIMAGLATAGMLASTIMAGTITELAQAVGIGSADPTELTTIPGGDTPGGDGQNDGDGENGGDNDGDGENDGGDNGGDGDGDGENGGDGGDNGDGEHGGDNDGDENDGDGDGEDDGLDQATIDRLNEIAARARTGNDQSDLATDLLERELNELYPDDPGTASAIFDLMMEGATLEQAIGEVTGDWSGVPGGDPSQYTDEQRRRILEMLGIEIPEGADGLVDGGDELFDLLPDWLLAKVFNEGGGLSVNVPITGISTPGGLILPASASATLNAGASVDLGLVQTGVGFGQTQNVDIALQITGELSGSVGKSTLGKVYKYLERFGQVPPALEALLERNPLLRRALKGVPFSVAYSEFVGVELAYQATLTVDQASALAAGDTSGLPNVFDPNSFEPGNSVLIRGGDIAGSEFEFKYKLLQINDQTTDFDGLGFGATLLEDGTMAIFSGPIDAIERQTRIGLPGIGLVNSTELAGHDFTYAELDMNTPEGRAAYDEFISGGGLPPADGPGIRTAESYTITLDESLGGGFDFGVISGSTTFIENTGTVTTTNYSDGEQITTSTFGHSQGTIEIVGPSADNAVDMEASSLTLVLSDLGEHSADYVNLAYTNAELPNTSHHVQLTFAPADLATLQERALVAHNLNYQNFPDAGESALQNPTTFTAQLAAAQTNEEVMWVLMNSHQNGGARLAEDLLSLGIASSGDGSSAFDSDPLPGTIQVQATD